MDYLTTGFHFPHMCGRGRLVQVAVKLAQPADMKPVTTELIVHYELFSEDWQWIDFFT